MENKNCRSAKRFLREAGVLMIGGQGSALSNPFLLANHAWLRLSEKEQEALLEMLESVLALPYSGKPIEYLLSSGALEGIRVVLNEEESKLLTFIYDQPLRAYERVILQTYLDAHVEIRNRYPDSFAKENNVRRELVLCWDSLSLALKNPPSLTLESRVRLFSFSLQTLDIWGGNDYSSPTIIKTIQTRPPSQRDTTTNEYGK